MKSYKRIPDIDGTDPADFFEDQPQDLDPDLEWSAPTEGVHEPWWPYEGDEPDRSGQPRPPPRSR